MKKIYIFLLMFGLSQHSMFAQNWNFNWGGIGSGSSTETNSIFNFNFNNIDFSNLSGANFNININLGTNTNFGNFDFSNININNCCVEQPFEDISFGYDIGAALAASALIQEARDRDLNQWFDRQHTVLKEEIERQLGQSFSDYNDARNTYFKFHERIGIHGNHIPIENKYNTRRLDEENKRSISVRNLKLLRLRENELRTGNINNSSYGNFSYNGTSLDQVQSLSQLQSLWRNEYSTFSNVQLRYHNDYYTYLKIRSIGYITNYNDPLVVSLFNKQLANYNRYDRWKQLDLMQAYLNKIRPPLALPSGYISPKLYATPQYLENYAISHKGGGRSVFDSYYNMYGPFYQIWLAREDRQEARSQVNRYIRLRKNELNNLLNEVSLEDLIEQQLEENPFLLLDIDCNQIEKWQTLAQHTAPQSVQDKINNLPSSITNDFEIQALSDASGTAVNMDYFSVNITDLPDDPNTNEPFTADGFLDFLRLNFNDFVEDTSFDPYCEDVQPSICEQETDLWNSDNPLGAIIYIDIPFDDGVVVCSEYTNSYWYFMTMNAPFAGNHPVSGTRQFGYEQGLDGSYNFFVRGVDRVDSNIIENVAYFRGLGNPFFGSDALWEGFQTKIDTFVNNNGGSSSKNTPVTNRPDWNKVEQVLNGELPISELGCN